MSLTMAKNEDIKFVSMRTTAINNLAQKKPGWSSKVQEILQENKIIKEGLLPFMIL